MKILNSILNSNFDNMWHLSREIVFSVERKMVKCHFEILSSRYDLCCQIQNARHDLPIWFTTKGNPISVFLFPYQISLEKVIFYICNNFIIQKISNCIALVINFITENISLGKIENWTLVHYLKSYKHSNVALVG